MTGQLRIAAEIEGANAALEVAAALDEAAGAVSALEVSAASAKWRGGGASGARSISAPAAAYWRSPRRNGCVAGSLPATSIRVRCGWRTTTAGATVSPARSA